MICIARQHQIESSQVNSNPCVAYLLDDGSLEDAIEPIMYKFLQRTVEGLKSELDCVMQLPEKQFISSFEDLASNEKKDNDLSSALKRRRIPRQQKLAADLNILLGNFNDSG